MHSFSFYLMRCVCIMCRIKLKHLIFGLIVEQFQPWNQWRKQNEYRYQKAGKTTCDRLDFDLLRIFTIWNIPKWKKEEKKKNGIEVMRCDAFTNLLLIKLIYSVMKKTKGGKKCSAANTWRRKEKGKKMLKSLRMRWQGKCVRERLSFCACVVGVRNVYLL